VGNIKMRILSENLSSHASQHSDGKELQIEADRCAAEPTAANADSNSVRVVHETQGAMTQQCSDTAHGYDSMPQKLPQLIGHRDPEARSILLHRPARNRTG
jgi:hypothetical protein